ncbi:hypothetical protein Ahy_A06g030671 [Arachis hypogaea]|uniref:Uncharacterized protein n=1 Tax=Arachis hypogaea TaxID=3818 RepID=A0A445CX15_ARAHY|nr:hypothetical protein Ahy_A06g030671 [Arachis hypogaea]
MSCIMKNQITQPQPTNPSTVSLHHRRKEWHTAASVALKVRHPSVCLASLVIQVFNPCSLSPIAGASSSSASVVFVCSAALPSPFVCRSRSRLRSRSSPFTFARRSLFAFTRRSPFEFAFVFVWKPRCSASNTATNPRAPPSRRTALFCRSHLEEKKASKESQNPTGTSLLMNATSLDQTPEVVSGWCRRIGLKCQTS